MKRRILFTFLACFTSLLYTKAQNKQKTDQVLVAEACMDYLDGFYTGDTTKIIRSIKPRLHKFGFWKNKETGEYKLDSYMTFDEAVAYAKKVAEKNRTLPEGIPKKVEVLDVMNQIASAKVTAWWGTDYILLAKDNGKWMIEQVIWEGPLDRKPSN
jgi:hypothetical protein